MPDAKPTGQQGHRGPVLRCKGSSGRISRTLLRALTISLGIGMTQAHHTSRKSKPSSRTSTYSYVTPSPTTPTYLTSILPTSTYVPSVPPTSTFLTSVLPTTTNSSSTTTTAPSSSSSSSSTTSTTSPSSAPTDIWTPGAGTSWQIELSQTVTSTSTNGYAVWDLDLFDTSASIIAGLQSNGAKVICYFSGGSYENWRPDASSFQSSDLGNDLSGWAGERWLDISSSNVRSIMAARLDLAASKGCNGVDPDNVDGYNNDNGLGLTQADSIDYVTFLAGAASQRGLAIGLKNAGEIVPSVIDLVQYSVNEQCVAYSECGTFAPFIQQGKPVFHIEYPKGQSTSNTNAVSSSQAGPICGNAGAAGFSTVLKNIDLDAWIQTC